MSSKVANFRRRQEQKQLELFISIIVFRLYTEGYRLKLDTEPVGCPSGVYHSASNHHIAPKPAFRNNSRKLSPEERKTRKHNFNSRRNKTTEQILFDLERGKKTGWCLGSYGYLVLDFFIISKTFVYLYTLKETTIVCLFESFITHHNDDSGRETYLQIGSCQNNGTFLVITSLFFFFVQWIREEAFCLKIWGL